MDGSRDTLPPGRIDLGRTIDAGASRPSSQYHLLGGILSGLGRFSDAEPLLIESYEALRDDAGLPPRDRKEMLERLVRLYESWDAAEPGKGYAEKAAQWRGKLDELGTKAPRHEGTEGKED